LWRNFTARECGVVMFSVASVSVFVCLSVILQLENLDLESSIFNYTGTASDSRSSSCIKVIVSRSRSQGQKCVCILFAVVCLRLKGDLVSWHFLEG